MSAFRCETKRRPFPQLVCGIFCAVVNIICTIVVVDSASVGLIAVGQVITDVVNTSFDSVSDVVDTSFNLLRRASLVAVIQRIIVIGTSRKYKK